MRANAAKMVTKLYVPFIRPTHPAACSKPFSSGVTPNADSPMLVATNCQ
jgi:hypothetical protein